MHPPWTIKGLGYFPCRQTVRWRHQRIIHALCSFAARELAGGSQRNFPSPPVSVIRVCRVQWPCTLRSLLRRLNPSKVFLYRRSPKTCRRQACLFSEVDDQRIVLRDRSSGMLMMVLRTEYSHPLTKCILFCLGNGSSLFWTARYYRKLSSPSFEGTTFSFGHHDLRFFQPVPSFAARVSLLTLPRIAKTRRRRRITRYHSLYYIERLICVYNTNTVWLTARLSAR